MLYTWGEYNIVCQLYSESFNVYMLTTYMQIQGFSLGLEFFDGLKALRGLFFF